jgi:hypothetical protein
MLVCTNNIFSLLKQLVINFKYPKVGLWILKFGFRYFFQVLFLLYKTQRQKYLSKYMFIALIS